MDYTKEFERIIEKRKIETSKIFIFCSWYCFGTIIQIIRR